MQPEPDSKPMCLITVLYHDMNINYRSYKVKNFITTDGKVQESHLSASHSMERIRYGLNKQEELLAERC